MANVQSSVVIEIIPRQEWLLYHSKVLLGPTHVNFHCHLALPSLLITKEHNVKSTVDGVFFFGYIICLGKRVTIGQSDTSRKVIQIKRPLVEEQP